MSLLYTGVDEVTIKGKLAINGGVNYELSCCQQLQVHRRSGETRI